LNPNPEKGSLDVYYIPHLLPATDFDSSRLPDAPLVCSFLLPELSFGRYYQEINASCSPNFNQADASAAGQSDTPFLPDPKKAVIAVTMLIQLAQDDETDNEDLDNSYQLIIHRHALLGLVHEEWIHSAQVAAKWRRFGGHDSRRKGHISYHIPWSKWGPQMSRFFDFHPGDFGHFPYSVSGQRHIQCCLAGAPVTIAGNSSLPEHRVIGVLYDFNPYTLKILKQNQERVYCPLTADTHPQTIGTKISVVGLLNGPVVPHELEEDYQEGLYPELDHPSNMFHPGETFAEDPVIGRLPYARSYVFGNYEANDLLIDERRVIGLKVSERRSSGRVL